MHQFKTRLKALSPRQRAIAWGVSGVIASCLICGTCGGLLTALSSPSSALSAAAASALPPASPWPVVLR